MSSQVVKVTSSDAVASEPNLIPRLLGGEVIVARRGLQQAGLFDVMLNDSIGAVRGLLGDEMTDRILSVGFEKIHEIVEPAQIPAVTEAIYQVAEAHAADYLRTLIPAIFGDRNYYYESAPNVRFHIPFKEAKAHAKLFASFTEKRGEGKITSHGPHRDSWLDCPDNGVNIWIALGRVRKGNGLTVFMNEYHQTQTFTEVGEVTDKERLTQPATFDLEPGDFIIFHTDHLHGSELNHTDETRFVISFRMTFDKPHFPRGHYHPYHHAGLAKGPLKGLSTLPAWMQGSFIRSGFERAAKKFLPQSEKPEIVQAPVHAGDLRASDLQVGEIRAVSETACVAKLGEDQLVAFSRRCPHKGADLANGYVASGQIVCPWHNLPFDPTTGVAACEALKPLLIHSLDVEAGVLKVGAPQKPRRAEQPALSS